MQKVFTGFAQFIFKLTLLLSLLAASSGRAQTWNSGSTNNIPPDTNLFLFVRFYKDGGVRPVSYDQNGATDGRLLFRGAPVLQSGFSYYGVISTQMARIPYPQGAHQSTQPSLTQPIALALDTTRNRLLALAGGGSMLFIVPAASATNDPIPWTLLADYSPLKLQSITYNPHVDRYFAVEYSTNQSALIVHRIAPNGARDVAAILPNFTLPPGARSHLVQADNSQDMALLVESDVNHPAASGESRIYAISRTAGVEPRLVHSKIWAPWPPALPPDPTVELISPSNGSEFRPGTNILLTARGLNGSFINMTFRTNNGGLRTVSNLVNSGSTQVVSTIWSNVPPGSFAIRAVGQTAWGMMVTSAPITILATNRIEFLAERSMPSNYVAGVPLTVTVRVRPSTNVSAYAIEDAPPQGWTVANVSSPGAYDPVMRKVKWGPITTTLPTESFLTYQVTPPPNAVGLQRFTGIASVNGLSREITGQQTITAGATKHPADRLPADNRLTINEITSYATAWRNGADWNIPPTEIPLSYVTRAGFLWRSGEYYRFNSNFTAPNSWEPSSNNLVVFSVAVPSEATRTLAPAFTRGRATLVILRIRPGARVQSYALEERPPAGWTIVNAGSFAVVRGTLRAGPYFDNQERILTYTVTPPSDATRGDFHGQVSFDGSDDPIRGAVLLSPPAPVAERVDQNKIRLRLNATPGERFLVESADTVEATEWTLVTTITGYEIPIELPSIEAVDRQKFYRLRPVP